MTIVIKYIVFRGCLIAIFCAAFTKIIFYLGILLEYFILPI